MGNLSLRDFEPLLCMYVSDEWLNFTLGLPLSQSENSSPQIQNV